MSNPLGVIASAPPRWNDGVWRTFAACEGDDINTFFPRGTTGPALDEIRRAKAVCADCPVQQQCLTFAVITNQEFGVWGGQDEEERRITRRRWRAGLRS